MVLRALADADIEHGRYPSPAADVCVSFLLRETRFMEALEVSQDITIFFFFPRVWDLKNCLLHTAQVHEKHSYAVSASGRSELALPHFETRRALIVAHASIPTISKDSFRTVA